MSSTRYISPVTAALIAAASAAYPDGLIADCLNPNTPDGFQLPEDMPGDTLAAFIAREIVEVTMGEPSPLEGAATARRAMERARRELDAVIDALVEAEARAGEAQS